MADLKERIQEMKTAAENARLGTPDPAAAFRAYLNEFIAKCDPDSVLALIAEIERLQEQWDTRFDTLCGNCGQRYRGPRDDGKHGIGICK